MGWRVFAASATGKSHADKGIPCQDAFAHVVVGDTLIAVVCDGAGSARYSAAGAEFTARAIVHALSTRLAQGEELTELSATEFSTTIATVIGAVRGALQDMAHAAGAGLSDYASTVVGVATTSLQGCFFHIGDGLGMAQPAAVGASPQISLPANGEYANETYFITGAHWQDQLRVMPVRQPLRAVTLMSDGAMPFVMGRNNTQAHAPFIEPVERFLSTVSEADGSRALAGTLGDPRTDQITGDDKTLLIAHCDG